DGSFYNQEMTVTPLPDERGEITRFIAVNQDITERRLAEEALRESENRFATMANSAPVLIWISGTDKLCTYFNKPWLDFTGRTLAQESGNGWADGVHPDDLARCLETYVVSFDAQKPFEMEYRLRRHDGEYRWVIDHGVPRFHPDGSFSGYIGSCIDITERNQAETALTVMAQRNATILQAASDGIHVLDERGNVVEANAAFCRLLGYTREEMLCLSATDWDMQWSPAELLRKIQELVAQPASTFETRHRGKDGTIHEVEINAVGVTLEGKNYLYASARDITERTQRNNALQASETRHRVLVENAPYCIHEIDLKGCLSSMNRAGLKMMGLENEADVIGMAYLPIVAEPDRERISELMTLAFAGQASEFEFVAVNGCCFQSSFVPIMDDQKKVVRLMGITQDITERKLVEQFMRISREILKILNEPGTLRESIHRVITELKTQGGFDAVGIRLEDGEDYPYFVQQGFSRKFLQTENTLMARDMNGGVCRNKDGSICLECTCGMVISGKTVPASSHFTPDGSFWTNDSIPMLDIPATEDPRLHPRNLCIHHGYASVALIPIRHHQKIIGLLQLNDRRKGRFSPAAIKFLEGISTHIGSAMLRKRAEDAVSESKERYRTVADFTHDWEYWQLPDGHLTYVSPSCERISGYQAREFQENPELSVNIVHPEDREVFAALFHNSAETVDDLTPHEMEFRILTRDGQERWIHHNWQMVIASDGKFQGRRASNRDITVRKQAQAALQLKSAALEAAANAIVITDREGVIEWVNTAFSTVTGYTSAEAVGKNPRDLVKSGRHDEAFYKVLWDTIVAGNVWHGEMVNRRKDNTLYTEDLVITPLKNGRGEITNFIAIKQDITERKRAEAALQLEGAALEAAANAIVILDRSGRIEWVNAAFTTLTGYGTAEAAGKNSRDLVKSGRHDTAFYKKLWSTILAGNVWHGEITNRRKNGTLYTEDMTITPLKSERGEITNFIAIKQDITERKSLEKQFLRSQRMESIGLLAGGIAHDLNNVLAPILMGAEMLRMDANAEDEQTLSQLDEIAQSARRGADIVKQVLTFARGIEGARVTLHPRHIIKDMVRMVRETFPRNIRIRSALPDDLWPVVGDPTQLHQVMLNLSVNARDAMPEGGELSFNARNVEVDGKLAGSNPGAKPGPHVLVCVKDTGTGIPPELLDRIFEPFFTTKEFGKGTGLGLSTVMGIVRSHGGFVAVESEPGRGTSFNVHLPATPQAADGETAEKTEPVPHGQGETVLLVDDEECILQITRAMLERHGYRVITAGDGAEALSHLSLNLSEVKLLLTDIMMPLMDGVQLIRAAKRLSTRLRVIASSGALGMPGQKDRTDEVLALGVKHILHKPYEAETMLRMVHDELHKNPAAQP
ncbi:MAG: PAS domain S-box protein, partial [Limisphaerales bacterium]